LLPTPARQERRLRGRPQLLPLAGVGIPAMRMTELTCFGQTSNFAHQIETAQPFAEHGISDVAGGVQMIAQALSSAGEVRNGSSRMKEGVRLRGIGRDILVASTGFKPSV
jgi:hypothetical protein